MQHPDVCTTSIDATWLDWLAEGAGAKVEVDSEVIASPANHALCSEIVSPTAGAAASEHHQQLLSVGTPELLVLVGRRLGSVLGAGAS